MSKRKITKKNASSPKKKAIREVKEKIVEKKSWWGKLKDWFTYEEDDDDVIVAGDSVLSDSIIEVLAGLGKTRYPEVLP